MGKWYEIFDECGRPVLTTEREEVANEALDQRPGHSVYTHACRYGEGNSAEKGFCPRCGERQADP
jgi:hypothetical protein